MFGKCLVCFVMCVVTCYVKAGREESYSPEEYPCLMNGGTCVRQGDCRKQQLALLEGLCPKKLECCYGLPVSATGCGDQGGKCFERTYPCATWTRADDCAQDEHCCILVN